MDNKDQLKICDDWENCDDWEDDWENCDEIEAKLKTNIEETKKKELQQLVDKAEEDLIEDLFLHDPLLKKVEQKQIKGHPLTLLRDKGAAEGGDKAFTVEKNLKKEDNEKKLREKKKKQLALKKRQEELFGDASLDSIQDQYCDFEDRY